MKLDFLRADDRAGRCRDAVRSGYTPEQQALNALFIHANDPDADAKLANNRHLTPDEKRIATAIVEQNLRCDIVALEGAATVHPSMVALLARWYASRDERAARLLQDRMTVGEYNAQSMQQDARFRQEWHGLFLEIYRYPEQGPAQARADRHEAAGYLQQWSLLQQRLRNGYGRATVVHCDYPDDTLACQVLETGDN